MLICVSTHTPQNSLPISARLAPFNAWKHGKRIQFQEDFSVAERVGPEDFNGIVYTALSVAVGEIWRITVLTTTEKGRKGLVSEWVLCVMLWQKVGCVAHYFARWHFSKLFCGTAIVLPTNYFTGAIFPQSLRTLHILKGLMFTLHCYYNQQLFPDQPKRMGRTGIRKGLTDVF